MATTKMIRNAKSIKSPDWRVSPMTDSPFRVSVSNSPRDMIQLAKLLDCGFDHEACLE